MPILILLVFDLDFTLRDAGVTWCDQTNPHYKKIDSSLEDVDGRVIYLYPDVMAIFESLCKKAGVPYQEMFFFDDEHMNILEVGSLGLNSYLGRSGLNWQEVKAAPGLGQWTLNA